MLVLPYIAWSMLMINNGIGKTLSNLGEPVYFAFLTPVVALLRILFAKWVPDSVCAYSFIAIMCGVAIASYLFVPGLPE